MIAFSSQEVKPIELDAIHFPLHGSRLIEASAGTGKTYTIAALFVRLILGHGAEPVHDEKQQEAHDALESSAFHRPLLPSEILVMTFTKAATQELSSRIQSRLVEIADHFRQPQAMPSNDDFVCKLIQAYPNENDRLYAAWQLEQAAQCMDESSVFTIDAWCQKALREHAVHTGQPFDEELIVSESELRQNAVEDFWRKAVYSMDLDLATQMKRLFPNEMIELRDSIEKYFKEQTSPLALELDISSDRFANDFKKLSADHLKELASFKAHLGDLSRTLSEWIEVQWLTYRPQWDGVRLGQKNLRNWLNELQKWCENEADDHFPAKLKERWERFSTVAFLNARKVDAPEVDLPDFIDEFYQLGKTLLKFSSLLDKSWPLVVSCISKEIEALKKQRGQFGFSDLLHRLHEALRSEHGQFLKSQLREQFPVIMVDEFQDTSPIQFSIFNEIYNIKENSNQTGIFLIGDPKQSIYSFRGADIKSYLMAKSSTYPRHYVLGKNFRSTLALVNAVNGLFLHSEMNSKEGAFSYRNAMENPLPFLPVQAQGLRDQLIFDDSPVPAITTVYSTQLSSNKDTQNWYANACAAQVVKWLNATNLQFKSINASSHDPKEFRKIAPADIAVLVRTGAEAKAVRSALSQRGVASVYLSDKDSVFQTQEARDLAYWMRAVLAPMDTMKVKTALALPFLDLSIQELHKLNEDDVLFDQYVNWIKELEKVWIEHGILAMIRKTLSIFDLPIKWLRQSQGQRKLTNVLQLSELLQAQSSRVHAQKGLLDWLINALSDQSSGIEEHILRLESDAQLVKVVTIHKSKGLEFNVVMMPFATTFRARNGGTKEQEFDVNSQSSESDTDPSHLHSQSEATKEDIRLLYVALTRAKHAIWLGFSRLSSRVKDRCVTHQSALGALLTHGNPIQDEKEWVELLERHFSNDHMSLLKLNTIEEDHSRLEKNFRDEELKGPLAFNGQLDRDYRFSSFSSLLRWRPQDTDSLELMATNMPSPADDEPVIIESQTSSPFSAVQTTLEEVRGTLTLSNRLHSAHPYLAIAGGLEVGNFIHELLRWSLGECKGILKTPIFHTKLLEKIQNSLPSKIRQQESLISTTYEISNQHFVDDVLWQEKSNVTKLIFKWIDKILSTPIEELGLCLSDFRSRLTETEFWMRCERFRTEEIERIVYKCFLPNRARLPVSKAHWHGMLMGFADLLFECKGKYFVLDYKTNTLGFELSDYQLDAIESDVLQNRYDLQAAIYVFALHQLLKSRLGQAYDPDQHLGGAYIWYLRGVSSKGQGLCFLKASSSMLSKLEASLLDSSSPLGSMVLTSDEGLQS